MAESPAEAVEVHKIAAIYSAAIEEILTHTASGDLRGRMIQHQLYSFFWACCAASEKIEQGEETENKTPLPPPPPPQGPPKQTIGGI